MRIDDCISGICKLECVIVATVRNCLNIVPTVYRNVIFAILFWCFDIDLLCSEDRYKIKNLGTDYYCEISEMFLFRHAQHTSKDGQVHNITLRIVIRLHNH